MGARYVGGLRRKTIRVVLVPEDYAADAFGLLLLKLSPAPFIRERFSPDAAGQMQYEQHLDELAERHAAGIANEKPKFKANPKAYRIRPRLFLNGKPLKWDDLKTVGCSGCGRTLLGPSHEPVRRYAKSRGHTLSMRALPKPVAGYRNGRPVCGGCHKQLNEGQ